VRKSGHFGGDFIVNLRASAVIYNTRRYLYEQGHAYNNARLLTATYRRRSTSFGRLRAMAWPVS
jgi:hypothetical protein